MKAPTHERLAELLENRAEFLAFVQRRVGDRTRAEDLLQDVTVRSLGTLDRLAAHVPVVPWFFKVLRNAVVDDVRRRDVAQRAIGRYALEHPEVESARERQANTCRCLHRVKDSLKPEYAEAIDRVELEGVGVKDWAESIGISSNNGAVRVHRARTALKVQLEKTCGACAAEGCTDCTC